MMLIALIILIVITILLFAKVVTLDYSNDMKNIEIRNLEIKAEQLEHIAKRN